MTIDIKKTQAGLEHRAVHEGRKTAKEAEDRRQVGLKTFEELKKKEQEDLVKQMAIIMGLVKPS
jgi:hypothetical protein